MARFRSTGGFPKTVRFLKKVSETDFLKKADFWGQKGVEALEAATPKRTGLTAASWTYRIERVGDKIRIGWINTNEHNGVPIAILIQYGHATRTGGYVAGVDYINPAMKPVFDEIVKESWLEVIG